MVAAVIESDRAEERFWRVEFNTRCGVHRARLIRPAPAIPDVTGLSRRDAALAYARAGFYVLPVAAGKHPGSVVGKGWPDKSTRDPETVAAYWDGDNPPGIALHTGRSGVVAIDIDDLDVLPAELAWLKTAVFQSSRSGRGVRGHYVFTTDETFSSGKLYTSDGHHVGEVRSGNTVIIAEPTPHMDADAGGRYAWQATGTPPQLPEAGRAALTAKAGGVEPTADADVVAFAAEHIDNRAPGRLAAVVRRVAQATTATRDAARDALCQAAREARAGCYPWTVARDQIEVAAQQSYSDRGATFDPVDFEQCCRYAVGQANAADVDDLRARAERDYGDDHRDYAGLIERFAERLSAATTGDFGEAEYAGQTADKRNAPLDLRRLRTQPRKPVSWLLPDVLARDSYVSVSAAPGTGKSVLARSLAVDASIGRNHTDHAETFDPARVIYLDAENGEDWWRDGLDAMSAPMDLPNLAVVCFPDVGALDTAKGAREFLELITECAADLGGVDLVVLDTVSRFIAGGENDADTWSQFYRHSIQPLRDRKIAVLRLDHLGKNADLGPRGSSHKLSDVDADFRLTTPTPGSDDLVLTLGKRRRPHFAETARLRRIDNPLRHERRAVAAAMTTQQSDGRVAAVDPQVAALVADLNRLGVDSALGRSAAQAAYAAAGGTLGGGNDRWAAAVKVRKTNARIQASNGGQQS